MNDRINPFNEVYVTESIGSNKFVELFSPILVESALSIFQPGHIVLKGLIGTGKSMLLNLLKPDIRLAYFQSNKNFPVPKPYKKFIGAGINLRRSGINDFSQRPIEFGGLPASEISPIFFGDFLNYWIVWDIFKSIECLRTEKELSTEIGIDFNDQDKLDQFAIDLSKDDCWSGYLDGTESYEELRNNLSGRITSYRAYLNYNTGEIDSRIAESKTIVGVPIIKTASKLKDHGLIDDDTEFYVRLDQYEDLERSYGNELGLKYQEIIHKLLGMRDFSVSYKIGTRAYGWSKGANKIYGTEGILERKRDYNELSIEELFKKSENIRTLFPQFSEDIFRRRLEFAGYKDPYDTSKGFIKYVFGTNLRPEERINEFYVRSHSSRQKVIHIDENWPDEWRQFLENEANNSLLSARLAEAWARQKGKEDIVQNIPSPPYPWENKKWWRKERIEQALMQIASRNSQNLHWSGYEDIMDLSGGSILAFIYLSKYIWDAWLKDNQFKIDTDLVPSIDRKIQSLGIEKASYYWFEDINSESGGDRRKKFIRFVGNLLYNKLSNDLPMSYPGHNGFSLQKEDLESDSLVNKFLRESSDYGDLDHSEHTSRAKKEGKRIKWHLSKILSPYFKIPSAHTKEPYYVKVSTIRKWLVKSEAFSENELGIKLPNERNSSSQTQLDL
ncbi:hypothetical protein [Reichenbachiella sp.]|uniref:ORC-CDC6 family AAA ATPase n=1 Tax=Reichenbachiella sp. TaxID=2184521 RepID=UPI0032991824